MPTVSLVGENDSLRPFGTAPSGSFTNDVNFSASTQTYEFTYVSVDTTITYSIDITSSEVQNGMLQIGGKINNEPTMQLITEGGTLYRDRAGSIVRPSDFATLATIKLDKHNLLDNRVILTYSETLDDVTTSKTYEFWIEGKTLIIHISSASTAGLSNYAGASCGRTENTPGAYDVILPYSMDPIIILPDQRFISTYIDRSLSSSCEFQRRYGSYSETSILASNDAINVPDSAGLVSPLNETVYVTLSNYILDVLPRPNHSSSPYRDQLVDRVVLDIWKQDVGFPLEKQSAVSRDWVCPSDGIAHVYGQVYDFDNECGDGVIARIRHNGSDVWYGKLDPSDTEGYDFDLSLMLISGDVLSFRIEPYAYIDCDSTFFSSTIVLGNETYSSSADFSSTQGYRGWYYREYDCLDTADDLVWSYDHWQGKAQYTSLTSWGGHAPPNQKFSQAVEMLKRYSEYGMSEILVVYHDWQHYGYDVGLPMHYPPNESYGGELAMKQLVETAHELGMMFTLHENYVDMYPDNPPSYPNPKYDDDAIAKWPDLSLKYGWYHPGTGQQAYRIANDKAPGIAAIESSTTQSAFKPSATYMDVLTTIPPSLTIDFDALNPTPKTYAEAVRQAKILFEQQRNIYGGPLVGEGSSSVDNYDSFFAGYVDGVERQIEGNWNAFIIPEFELFAIQPLMINHGMGYPCRFFINPGEVQQPIDYEQVDWYRYRAFEIAYGHAGFMGGDNKSPSFPIYSYYQFPEYYLMQTTQSHYLAASTEQVLYWDGAGYVPLEHALNQGYDFQRARVRISYDNGTEVIVNCDDRTSTRNSLIDFSGYQGAFGWEYLEWGNEHYQPMTWDAESNFWQGSEYWCRIYDRCMHPDISDAVRRWICPIDNVSCYVQGFVDRMDPNGDGVEVEIYHNGKDKGDIKWAQAISAGQSATFSFDINLDKDDTLDFHLGKGGNENYDTTAFTITITYQIPGSETWVTSTPSGIYTLPSMGWIVWNEADDFLSFSAQDGSGRRLEYVRSNKYDFLRSTDGNISSYGGLTTDGMLAIDHTNEGLFRNIHLVQGTLAMSSEAPYGLVQLSQRGDVNINYQDEYNLVLSVRNLSGDTTGVTYGDFPASWRYEDGILRDGITVLELGSNALPTGQTISWSSPGSGTDLMISDACDNSSYLICYARVDTTPPTTPVVTDDGSYISSITQLHAAWTSSDPESGIAEYRYAIGTSPGETDIVGWTSAGMDTDVTHSGLHLTLGTTYYFAVRAENGEGLWSEVGISDGISVSEAGEGIPSWVWISIGVVVVAILGALIGRHLVRRRT